MTTLILILTIFNIGWTLILIGSGISMMKKFIADVGTQVNHNTNNSIEQLGTAIFNMDSLKQKASMTGKAEV